VNLRAYGPGPIGEHFGALAGAAPAGLIRHLGVSSVRPGQLAEAQATAPVVCAQNRFSLDEHSVAVDEFVRACGEQGIAFVPYVAIAPAAPRPALVIMGSLSLSPRQSHDHGQVILAGGCPGRVVRVTI
jgi:diketogulonate reductase-like aldo/keto reductase